MGAHNTLGKGRDSVCGRTGDSSASCFGPEHGSWKAPYTLVPEPSAERKNINLKKITAAVTRTFSAVQRESEVHTGLCALASPLLPNAA